MKPLIAVLILMSSWAAAAGNEMELLRAQSERQVEEMQFLSGFATDTVPSRIGFQAGTPVPRRDGRLHAFLYDQKLNRHGTSFAGELATFAARDRVRFDPSAGKYVQHEMTGALLAVGARQRLFRLGYGDRLGKKGVHAAPYVGAGVIPLTVHDTYRSDRPDIKIRDRKDPDERTVAPSSYLEAGVELTLPHTIALQAFGRRYYGSIQSTFAGIAGMIAIPKKRSAEPNRNGD